MPAGAKPGERRGGRKKGTGNKCLSAIKGLESATAIMDRLGHNPIEGMTLAAQGRVPCGTCIGPDLKPTGRTRYKLPEGKHAADCNIAAAKVPWKCVCEGIGSRVCESCFGTLWERISVDTKLKANSELAKYRHPQLKSMEVSNPDGSLSISAILRQRYKK